MKRNIQIISTLVLMLTIIGSYAVGASEITDVAASLWGTKEKEALHTINTDSYYPALYTVSQDCSTLFAYGSDSGEKSKFHKTIVNGTFTITEPESVKGPNSMVKLYLKNEKAYNGNSYKGKFLH